MGCAAHSTSTGKHGGYLNAHLVWRNTCGSQPTRKSVLYASQTTIVPILRPIRTEGLNGIGANLKPSFEMHTSRVRPLSVSALFLTRDLTISLIMSPLNSSAIQISSQAWHQLIIFCKIQEKQFFVPQSKTKDMEEKNKKYRTNWHRMLSYFSLRFPAFY